MPTDSELISQFSSLSANAREILQKLVDFKQQASGDVTWNLSTGNITTPCLSSLIDTMWQDFLGSESAVMTYTSQGNLNTMVITLINGNSVHYTFAYTNDRASSVTLVLKSPAGATIWTKTKNYTYDSNDQLISIT